MLSYHQQCELEIIKRSLWLVSYFSQQLQSLPRFSALCWCVAFWLIVTMVRKTYFITFPFLGVGENQVAQKPVVPYIYICVYIYIYIYVCIYILFFFLNLVGCSGKYLDGAGLLSLGTELLSELSKCVHPQIVGELLSTFIPDWNALIVEVGVKTEGRFLLLGL